MSKSAAMLPTFTAGRLAGPRRSHQRGAAALVVVMVLFFIISLVAAYAARNIVFEQRTSANQYRSTVAFEAADAGLEWALSMLNGPRIDDDCQATTVPVNNATLEQTSFRDRYFEFLRTPASAAAEPGIHPGSGLITVRAPVRTGPVWPTCVFDNATKSWTCQCPRSAGTSLTPPTAAGYAPAFRVRFVNVNQFSVTGTPERPSVVRIEVNGCTSLDNDCLDFRPAHPQECRGTVCAVVALASGLKSVPVAALTARGGIDVGGATLSAFNREAGPAILAGGAVNQANLVLAGAPGSPGGPAKLVQNDPGLSSVAFTANRMFASVFGVWRSTYWNQPGAMTLICAGTCTGADVRTAVNDHPGRAILVPGNLDFDGGADIGSVDNPALVVVRGNVVFSAPTNVFGVVYAETANWSSSGSGQIRGAAIAEGQISGTGSFTVVRDPEVLSALRWRTGSFVKVPGSWKDYP